MSSQYDSAIELLEAGQRKFLYSVFGQLIELDQPECLMCGAYDYEASMNGPLVCSWCDMGMNPDGTLWTLEERKKRRARMKLVIAQTRTAVP